MVEAVIHLDQGREDRFPAGSRAPFKLVSEWKIRIRNS